MSQTTILVGDVRERLRDLADESVHCVVTSPPYFGLRDYGMAAQIGLEATPDAYVAEMVAVFREVRRVLRSDGTFWLNLGDSYASDSKWGGSTGGKHAKALHGNTNVGRGKRHTGLADKQRLMIPARVALALQADGWWLRDEIIWYKPNPMTISARDRTTPAHEMLYMFAPSSRYKYDIDSIKEPIAESSRKRLAQPSIQLQRGGAKQDAYERDGITSGSRRPNEIIQSLAAGGSELRHPRSVWTVPVRPFKGAHFATFPPDLVRPCILAGCPVGGTVLDPFFGAGTTGLVAAELGRNAIGVELNPEYAQIARERLGLDRPRLVVDLAAVRAEIALRPVLAALQVRLQTRA